MKNFARLWICVVSLSAALTASAGIQYRIQDDAVQALRAPNAGDDVRIVVPLGDGVPRELTLERFEVWTPDAQITLFGDHGTVLQKLPAPRTRYYRGFVEGDPESTVFIAVDGERIGGFVVHAGRRFGIGGSSSTQRRPDGRRDLMIEERTDLDDLQAGIAGILCEQPPQPPNPNAVSPDAIRAPVTVNASANGTRVLALAVETDYELYLNFGSNASTVSTFLGNLIGAGSVIYKRDLATELMIAHASVYTTSSDPYTATSSTLSALYELGHIFHGNPGPIPYTGRRSAVTLISGKYLGGGIAWLNMVGESDFSSGGNWVGPYSVSASIDDTVIPNPNTYPNYTIDAAMNLHAWALMVFTHELGHNVQSPHTHCIQMSAANQSLYGRATVDRCYGSEAGSGCWSGTGQLPTESPQRGTIMSYCHLLSGAYSNLRYTFGQPTDGSGIVAVNMSNRLAAVSPGIASLTVPSSLAVGASGTATVTATAAPNVSGDNFTYTWTVTNGTINSGQGTSTINFTATSDPVTVKVLVLNSRGVAFSDFATVSVSGGGGSDVCDTVATVRTGDTESLKAAPKVAGLPPGGIWTREVREGGESWTYKFTVGPASDAAAPSPAPATNQEPPDTRAGGAAARRSVDAPVTGALLVPRLGQVPPSSVTNLAGDPAGQGGGGAGIGTRGVEPIVARLAAPVALAKANIFEATFTDLPADAQIASARVFARVSHPRPDQVRARLYAGDGEYVIADGAAGVLPDQSGVVINRILDDELRGTVPSGSLTLLFDALGGEGVLEEAWVVLTTIPAKPVDIADATLDIAAWSAYLRTASAVGGVVVSQPSLGQTTYFHGEFDVYGSGSAVTMEFRAVLNGSTFCSGSGSVMPGYTYTAYCFDGWTATAGTHTLRFDFDYTNLVAETSESNNSVSKTITPSATVDIAAQRAYLMTGPGSGSEVSQPSVGQTVYFQTDYLVNGTGSSFDMTIRSVLNGSEFCAGTFNVTPGVSYWAWCLAGWAATSGTHTMRWDFDYTNTVAETNESNNSASKTITPTGAVDIAAVRAYLRTATSMGGSEVSQPTVGQTVYFYGDYVVSGGSGSILIPQRATLNGTPFCEGTASLPAGSYTVWCLDPWVATAGTHTLQWLWDHTNSVAETNESNNSASKTITPTSGVDIVAQRAFLKNAPSNGGSEVTSPTVGQTLYFHTAFAVTGSGSPITVTKRALLDGSVYCTCQNAATPGSTYVSACLDGWTATAGTHTLQWDFDYGNAVAETNEGNNSTSASFTPAPAGDTTAPVGNVVINGGNSFTGSTGVTLALSASDAVGVTGYYLSTSSTNPTAGQGGWVAVGPVTSFNSTAGFALPAGDGAKTVYAWYKDAAGNVSARYSDSISLDQTAPSNGTLSAVPGPLRVTLLWSGQSDAISGLAGTKLVFAVGSTPPANCDGTALATASPYVHIGLTPGQAYAYRVCGTDGVGNTSSGATASATPAPLGPRARNDINGDLRADIFWRNSSTGQTSLWFMNGSSYSSATFGPTVPPGWAPAVAGDFDGDARMDFFWHNGSTGQTSVWLGWNGSAFASLLTGLTIPADWVPILAGDFNADGNSDIFWRNGTTGETSIWFMNGATYATAIRSTTVPTSWFPSLSGDFDADGRADIFWRSLSTGETSLWMGWNGAAFSVQVRSVTAPTAWVPAGAGDASGDGRSDIFWRNSSTGQTSLWVMNGAATPGFVTLTTVPTSWGAVAFGDYDGDTRTDAFWRNGTTGETSVWLGFNGTAFTTQVRSATIPTAWAPFHSR